MTGQALSDWAGRREEARDLLDLRQARLMESILPAPHPLAPGAAVPELWHWIWFHEPQPLDSLGRDGHPERGGFLPPVPLPRRMWAGGRFWFHGDLPLEAPAVKRSVIASVREKKGRSGPLCFVTVRHEIGPEEGPAAVTEEHDIVYRSDPAPGAPAPEPAAPPQGATLREVVTPSPVMLFRYSAVTFNGHRIHYDRDYCRETEGYPSLVFHGPLTGTLLAALARRMGGRPLARFSFRAVAPLFDDAPFAICARPEGDGARLWAETPGGALAVEAEAAWR